MMALHQLEYSPMELFLLCLGLTVIYGVGAVLYPPVMVQFGILFLMHLAFTVAALALCLRARRYDERGE
jgi:Flp pilus assembly protein TadB